MRRLKSCIADEVTLPAYRIRFEMTVPFQRTAISYKILYSGCGGEVTS